MNEELLEEFAAWREQKAVAQPDLSAAAFLKEREAAEDRRRIEDALSLLAPVENDGIYPSDYDANVAGHYYDLLTHVHSVLLDDRDVVEECNFSGETRVHIR